MKRIFNKKTLFTILAILIAITIYQFGGKAYENYKHKKYLANLTNTASPNVKVLKDSIYIDYLDAYRTIRVYLPPSYEKSPYRYPVIYFLDGQSLFDELVLEGPEWQVDEIIDSTVMMRGPGTIVIGIDNTDDRSTEYKPFLSPDMPDETEVTGDKHAEWIATDLKAWVDSTFQTKPEPRHSVIGGASLGGLMAYYITAKYPDVFGNAIILSPSLWVNDKVFDLHKEVPSFKNHRIYMNIGKDEGGSMIPNAKRLHHTLIAKGMTEANLRFDIEKGHGHWHPLWRKGFKKAYPWIIQR